MLKSILNSNHFIRKINIHYKYKIHYLECKLTGHSMFYEINNYSKRGTFDLQYNYTSDIKKHGTNTNNISSRFLIMGTI